jgi:hypothetical protein
MPQKYYAKLNEQRAALAKQHPDGTLFVMSVAHPLGRSTAGNVCEVPVPIGARLLLDGTHRVADEPEIATFRADQALRRAMATGTPVTVEAARARAGITAPAKGK